MVTTLKPGWWSVLALAGLVAAVGVTFAGALAGGFVGIDDGNNIFLNPQMGGLNWPRVAWAFGDLDSARRYLPLGWLGISAVFSWQGLAPAGYHAASLGWHLVSTVALFATAQRILRLRTTRGSEGWNTGVAVLVTAAWALHPMRTEAVAWASGLLYTQASAFAFVAVWLWTRRWDSPARAGWLAGGCSLALAASLLSYPIALGLPVVCWLLDRVARRTAATSAQPARDGRDWNLLGPGLVTALALAANLAARGQNTENFAAAATLGEFGLVDRGWQALYVWGRYIAQLVYPVHLSPAYTELYSLHPVERTVEATAALSVAWLALSGWLIWRKRLSPVPLVAYTAMVFPFLGFLEHPWIAQDRYAMLLHPVWLVAAGWWLAGLTTARSRLIAAMMASVLIAIGAVSAHSLVRVWRTPWTLHARLLELLPRNAWSGYYLGKIPASVLFLDGRFDEIPGMLDRAESVAPGWSAAPARGEFSGLIRQHESFLRQNWPGRRLAPVAVLHYLHGRAAVERKDWVTARAHFRAALAAADDFGEARKDLAWCERQLDGARGVSP